MNMRFSSPRSLLLATYLLFTTIAEAHSTVRNPVDVVSTIQNATISTVTTRLTALSEFDLTFNIQGDLHVKLQLEPNYDILGDGASVQYLAADGTISREEVIDRSEHKVFLGETYIKGPSTGFDQWQHAGWARVNVHQDGKTPIFEGVFVVDHISYHVQTSTNYAQTRHAFDPDVVVAEHDIEEYMVVWRDSDILDENPEHRHSDLRRDAAQDANTCRSDSLAFNSDPNHPVFLAMAKRSDDFLGRMDFSNLFKRQLDSTTGGNSAGINLASSIGSTVGCPSTRKVALVGVATDCTYTAQFSSVNATRQNALTQMNTASAIWEKTFNISLAVQNIIVSEATCPGTPAAATQWNQACSGSTDVDARLNLFSTWRGSQSDGNSHWTLLTTCNTGSTVGLAWLGQACAVGTRNGPNGAKYAGANVVVRTPGASEWQVIAHETGHTYGAVHDCDSSACADASFVASQQCCPLSGNSCDAGRRYIMNPSSSPGVDTFSLCTIGNVCTALSRNSVNGTCLTDNRRVSTISDPICGNGIVETGEDCDCGGTANCQGNACCNPTTCKFTTGSVCDDRNEDCCRSCQFASASTVCRASTGQCDPQETCSGTSAFCPADVKNPDGSSCGNGLQCASGQCTNRDQQCKIIMGGTYMLGNDTQSCDDTSCTIRCTSSAFARGTCYSINQYFLDGTSCENGGKCYNVSFFLDNKSHAESVWLY
jgi:hypothetical protein